MYAPTGMYAFIHDNSTQHDYQPYLKYKIVVMFILYFLFIGLFPWLSAIGRLHWLINTLFLSAYMPKAQEEKMFGIIGQFLQVLGVSVVLISQVIFYSRARRKYGSLEKAFLDMAFARFGAEDETLKESNKEKTKRLLEKFPLAQLLWNDFRASVIGLTLTMIGLIIELIV